MGIVQWVLEHSGLVAGLVVALLDFGFAVKPDWQSNGVLHWVYVQLKALVPPKKAE